MFYCLYQITNLVNGKIYVGVHKTLDLNDGYMGSGKVIRRAIEKHGIENFKKDILETFDTAEDMYAREKEVVTEDFLNRSDVYNLRRGGTGGFDWINKQHMNRRYGSANAFSRINDEMCRRSLVKRHQTGGWGDKISEAKKKFYETNPGNFTGKTHTDDTKRKIGQANSNRQRGEKNSQHGTCWIYHELIGSRKCKLEQLPLFIDQGWIKGRVVKQ